MATQPLSFSNSTPKTWLDKIFVDPLFDLAEKAAVETIKLPINLIRKGVSFAINEIVDLIFIPVSNIVL